MLGLRLYIDLAKAEEGSGGGKPPSLSPKDRGLRYASAEEIANRNLDVVEPAKHGSGGYVRIGASSPKGSAENTKETDTKPDETDQITPSETKETPTTEETPAQEAPSTEEKPTQAETKTEEESTDTPQPPSSGKQPSLDFTEIPEKDRSAALDFVRNKLGDEKLYNEMKAAYEKEAKAKSKENSNKKNDAIRELIERDKKREKDRQTRYELGKYSRMGHQIGAAAANTESGGADVASASVSAYSEGMNAVATSLLSKEEKEEAEEENPQEEELSRDDEEEKEVKKAVSTSSASSAGASNPQEQRAIKYKRSFSKEPRGVSGAYHPTDDDPAVGRKWKSPPIGETDDIDEELEEYEKKQEKLGVIKADIDSLSLIKSLSEEVYSYANCSPLRAEELTFLVEECGYTRSEALKLGITKGFHKKRFSTWLEDRLEKSLENLKRSF